MEPPEIYPEASPEETDAIADNELDMIFQIESVIDKIKEVAAQKLHREDDREFDYPYHNEQEIVHENNDGRIEFSRELLKMMEKS